MSELQGLQAMASVGSNLTLHSVLATLHTTKRPEDTARDIAFNEGVHAAINVIEVYKMVLAKEWETKVKANG
jgi:hypothetical protein